VIQILVDIAETCEHDAVVMLRATAFVVGVCLCGSSVARADEPAGQTPDAERQADFDLLVATGDRARAFGRYEEAARAYHLALEKLPHPVVSGRLGLVLMKLGQLDRAAEELHEAFERGQGVSLQERREVAAAYDKAKIATTKVGVMISQVGANVTCDGQTWNREGMSSFWRFVMPGEHTIRAKLDGYEEIVQTFTAKAGDEITITLKFVPRPLPPLPQIKAPSSDVRKFPPILRTSNVAGDPNYDPKEDPFYGEPKPDKVQEKKGVRFSVYAGVVTVFGVASWNPAVGPVVGVGLRPHEHISFGLEGRAAWLTTGVGGRQISAMTAGGILSACGHLKWFFGCGIGQLGALNVRFSDATYVANSNTHFKPGVGGRVGAEVKLTTRFVLRSAFDVLALPESHRIRAGNVLVVDQPPLLIAGQVFGGWEI